MRTRKFYGCDGGCIMIGNSSFRVHLPNDIGDGKHQVTVIEGSDEEFNTNSARRVGVIEGPDIVVYKHDCLSREDIFKSKNILFLLSGKYSVYVCDGSIYLVDGKVKKVYRTR